MCVCVCVLLSVGFNSKEITDYDKVRPKPVQVCVCESVCVFGAVSFNMCNAG